MEYFIHSVDMPFSGIKILYRELNNQQILALTKTDLSNPLAEDTVEDYADFLQEIVLECVKNKQDFLKLNLIDYFLFLAKLREVSIGEDLELFLTKKENETNVKFTLTPSVFIERLYLSAKEALSKNILSLDQVDVELDWPNFKYEKFLIKTDSNTNLLDKIINCVYFFIKKITFNKTNVIDLTELKLSEIKTIYDNLPFLLRQKIQNVIINAISILKNSNIWNIKNIDGFVSGIDIFDFNYQNIFRLFFKEDYNNAMEEYYVLASKNILPTYLNTISIADRKLFVTFLVKEIENMQSNKTEDNSFEQL